MTSLPVTKWYPGMQDSADTLSAGSQVRSAFETAFDTYWPRVHSILLRFCEDPDEADDLSIEAFVRLHADFERIQRQNRVGGWLFRVATNLGLNALRSRRRRAVYEGWAGQEAYRIQSLNDPAETAERNERNRQVRQVLAELKPAHARLLVLRSLGLSYREIAAAVEVSIQSVGTRLNRAEEEFENRYRARFGEIS